MKIIVYFRFHWQIRYNKTNAISSEVICIINSSAQTDILLLDASNSCDLTLSKDIIVHRANKMKYKMTLFQFLLAIILVITSGQKINSFGTDSGIFVSKALCGLLKKTRIITFALTFADTVNWI